MWPLFEHCVEPLFFSFSFARSTCTLSLWFEILWVRFLWCSPSLLLSFVTSHTPYNFFPTHSLYHLQYSTIFFHKSRSPSIYRSFPACSYPRKAFGRLILCYIFVNTICFYIWVARLLDNAYDPVVKWTLNCLYKYASMYDISRRIDLLSHMNQKV